MKPDKTYLDLATQTLNIEADALLKHAQSIEAGSVELLSAMKQILKCKGKLIVTGVGKSGLIGAKMAATFASTGTPSFFLHPTEALHGDLGMIAKEDTVLAISYSGESSELGAILPHLKRFNVPLIGMTRDANSTLGTMSDIVIDISIEKEACPLGIAPTTSTTLTLALGDALAVMLMEARAFKKEDFASFHPGGSLGKQLFVKVKDLMQTQNLPVAKEGLAIKEAIIIMSEGRLGTVFILDKAQNFKAIVSDGDVRRALMDKNFSLDAPISSIANYSPKTLNDPDTLAVDALKRIEEEKIQLLAIVKEQKLLGAIHLHTLVEAGIK